MVGDWEKSKDELIAELADLRSRIEKLRVALDVKSNLSADSLTTVALPREILDFSPVPMCILSHDGRFLFINEAFTGVLGYRLEDMPDLDHWWIKAYPDQEYRQQMQNRWQAASAAPFQRPDFNKPGRQALVTCLDGSKRTVEIYGANFGQHNLIIVIDVTDKLRDQEEKDAYLRQLEGALARVKQLSGLLPICSNCKKIRDDQGYWQQVDQYIQKHSEALFSHSICPECIKQLYPELKLKK